MDALFNYRNSLAHAQFSLIDGNVFTVEVVQKLDEAGRGKELDEATADLFDRDDDRALKKLADEVGEYHIEVLGRSVGTPDLEMAGEHVRVASAAVIALEEELSKLSHG